MDKLGLTGMPFSPARRNVRIENWTCFQRRIVIDDDSRFNFEASETHVESIAALNEDQ
jgi:hypothetical protein